MCERLALGQGYPCPEGFPDDPQMWCHACRAAAAPAEPPCPLEQHQQEAYHGWLDLNRLDWYFLHLGRPPRN